MKWNKERINLLIVVMAAFVLLLNLKAWGICDISWWWVVSPFWLGALFYAFCYAVYCGSMFIE